LQDDIQVVVGQRIAKLRKARGFSQDQFAELAGLDRAHLYRIETGKQQSMTIRTLKLIAEVLEVRVTRILRGF
jgi:transcriptional regulator with XRE-family HTH domain